MCRRDKDETYILFSPIRVGAMDLYKSCLYVNKVINNLSKQLHRKGDIGIENNITLS